MAALPTAESANPRDPDVTIKEDDTGMEERRGRKAIKMEEEETLAPLVLVDRVKLEDEELIAVRDGQRIANNLSKCPMISLAVKKEEDRSLDDSVATPTAPSDPSINPLFPNLQRAVLSVPVGSHVARSEIEAFPCPQCGSRFTRRDGLADHQKTHAKNKPYLSSKSGEGFEYKKQLEERRKKNSHSGEKPFPCSECEKCFPSKTCLVEHLRAHTGEKPFTCSECERSFHVKACLVSHFRTHTGEKPYSCPECGKGLRSKQALDIHKRNHSGEKPFSCSECDKSFSSHYRLAHHLRSHTGEKPFACPDCGKCLTSKYHLINHQRIHTGEKPFACSACGKCLASKNNLVIHQRIHTGEKPYSCSECGKSFSSKKRLDIHKRIHSGERPFSCSECEKCFSEQSHLIRHFRTHTR